MNGSTEKRAGSVLIVVGRGGVFGINIGFFVQEYRCTNKSEPDDLFILPPGEEMWRFSSRRVSLLDALGKITEGYPPVIVSVRGN